METKNYASVLPRVKAAIFDSLIILLFMIIITFIFNKIEALHENYRIAAFLFVFVFYDPIFTSFTGGTIGHKLTGVQVKRQSDTLKNVIFPLALIRFLSKVLLGWLSLIIVTVSEKNRAVHDFIAGSVVLYK